VAAQDILDQHFKQLAQAGQAGFQRDWDIVNQRFGPSGNNIHLETARREALTQLRLKHQQQASALQQQYNNRLQVFDEIDGLISDKGKAEEAKMRTLLPADVRAQVFPKPDKEVDPLKAYGQLHTQGQQLQTELNKFQVGRSEGTGEKEKFYSTPTTIKTGYVPSWLGGSTAEVPAKGLFVKEQQYDSKTNKMVPVVRAANPDEISQWAQTTTRLGNLNKEKAAALDRINNSEHIASRIQMAAASSPRTGSGGTFADKVTQPSEEETPEQQSPAQASKPMFARNQSTGERKVSYDGGETWEDSQ
jgi:hypothetical protein